MLTLFKEIKHKSDNICREQESGNDMKDLQNNQRESPELKKKNKHKRSMSGFNNRLDIVGERISEKVQRNYPKYFKERKYQNKYREHIEI